MRTCAVFDRGRHEVILGSKNTIAEEEWDVSWWRCNSGRITHIFIYVPLCVCVFFCCCIFFQALLRLDIDKRITSLCEDAAAQKQVYI